MKQQTLVPPVYPARASVTVKSYAPHDFTHGMVLGGGAGPPPWADTLEYNRAQVSQRMCFGDGGRVTTVEERCDKIDGRYKNPAGKTGLKGRGLLGKWGPNHAADVIVTRQYVDGTLQVLLVQKHVGDNQSCLAFPAGHVEPGADVPATLRAELTQEAVKDSHAVDRLFAECRVGVVYRGHVDDFRNTDDAWMETTAVHFHATTEIADALQLGIIDKEEIAGVGWHDVASVTAMYASHLDWLQLVGAAFATEPAGPPPFRTKRKRYHQADGDGDGDDPNSVKRPANDENGTPVYVG